jgi:hypothetical protein
VAGPTTAVEFFEHPDVQYPLERKTDDFQAFVAERLGAYVRLIESMQPADEITRRTKGNFGTVEALCQ